MGYIEKNIVFIGDKNRMKLKALFDSGAEKSVMGRSDAQIICTLKKLEKTLEFEASDGHKTIVSEYCPFEAKIRDNNQNYILKGNVYILPDKLMGYDHGILIGASTMQKNKISLHFDEEKKENKFDFSRCTKIFRY